MDRDPASFRGQIPMRSMGPLFRPSLRHAHLRAQQVYLWCFACRPCSRVASPLRGAPAPPSEDAARSITTSQNLTFHVSRAPLLRGRIPTSWGPCSALRSGTLIYERSKFTSRVSRADPAPGSHPHYVGPLLRLPQGIAHYELLRAFRRR